ncbi:molecular chaperone [Rubidibacter lacunae KORDI 51-2]|uniref:Molecular chaperone n=1 Tax=Rubidibacter lacunae KORDI 51-2 TaxID=582515 RepID=U5D6L8_9CHRO|nr:Hsp70 family protein [Rubidibacter lacunae]ERN40303.1 molecular chaperone [Rubidibacter lacunae KORDI 51-2]
MAIAIDFGTSNTAVARWNSSTNAPEVLDLGEVAVAPAPDTPDAPVVPSLIYVENAATATVTIGQLVRDRGLDRAGNPRFFQRFKRAIGLEGLGFIPELDGRTVSFEQAGAWFLQTLLQQVGDRVGTVDSLVLTVPVDSFEAYRRWLGSICQSLPFEQVRLIDEPTAAALGYDAAADDLLLVIDCGGGTIDFACVQLASCASDRAPLGFLLKWGDKLIGEQSGQSVRTARVLAKAAVNWGGTDIDDWLLDLFARECGLPVSSLTARLVERLKVALSNRPHASEAYFDDASLESHVLELTRERFEALLRERGLFAELDRLSAQIQQQLRRSGRDFDDLAAVLLVGGTARIPALQTWAREIFTPDRVRADRPLSAVATGALRLAQGIELQDFLYHSYGIRYWNRRDNCHSWHPLIRAGQPYPLAQPVELVLGASVAGQPSIELAIGELGAASDSRTEVYFADDRLMTRAVGSSTVVQPLNDRDGARTVAVLDPPGQPGVDRVRVRFQVDTERLLRISVEDLLTQRPLLENSPVAELR